MANGELCKHCGDQETPHIHRQYAVESTCDTFESETPHHKDCPVLDCNGDCKATIRRADFAAKVEENRLTQVWRMDGPNLIIMDIGS